MKKWFVLILLAALLASPVPASAAFTATWNDAFEATPAGSSPVSIVDDRIRDFKRDLRERLQVGHNFSTHSSGTDDGTHKADIISLPGTIGVLYQGNTAGVAALANLSGKIAWDTTLSQLKANSGSAWAAILAAEPAGVVKLWAGTIATVPTGYLFCNGAAVSRTTYADLFTAIGTIYGVGDTSTTFNLPDLRDKFIVGAKQDDSGIPKSNIEGSLAASGGAATAPHTHTGPSHVHQWYDYFGVNSSAQTFDSNGSGVWTTFATNAGGVTQIAAGYAAGLSVDGYTTAAGTGATGSTSPAIIPPYYAISYIIKATAY